MRINAGNLKKGEFVFYQGDIWQVQKAEFYSPGKGSALMKARLKNINSGKNVDSTYKSNEQIETLEVQSVEMQYLYKDNESLYFMDERTYNQCAIPRLTAGDVSQFLKEGEKVFVYMHEDKPLNIRPPMSVILKVAATEDAIKGDTMTGAKKPATLETGVTVLVPLFVKAGELIKVNPETGQYTDRVKG
ncbi:elongation factor P [Candidatus Roizmanbacteria bacterium]|nr:elongation factor P [Candidatus Roizmanbacteria bacterium]